MASRRPPKKSETIEVRLPYATKVAFMARCQEQGATVSEAVRGFIDVRLETPTHAAPLGRMRLWQILAAALAGLAVGSVAAPSLAHPTESMRAAFDRLDRNHDGVLSFEEFSRR